MSPVRQVVLDTETTGLYANDGHRIVEIGCVEIVNRRLSGRTLHQYLNPERDVEARAQEIHGLSRERLESEPRFADVAQRILDFVVGAEVLIHNAPFDLGFLDAELERIGKPRFAESCDGILDTLALARAMHPGKRNSLDALCDRYGISNAHRTLHGALLDAELLADVFLAMTRGQESLEMLAGEDGGEAGAHNSGDEWPPRLRRISASAEEVAAHLRLLAGIEAERHAPAVWAEPDAAE